MVVSKHQHVLVKLCCLSSRQGKQIILGFYFSLGFQLVFQLLFFGTRLPNRDRFVVRVLVGTPHPFETAQLLVGVDLVVVLIFFFLLFLLFGFFYFVSSAFPGPFSRRFALRLLAPFCSRLRRPNLFLRRSVTSNVRYGLKFFLFSQFFSLLLLLLHFETFSRRLKLLFVHHEEVARPTFGKVWLCQNILHSCDWTDFSLFIDVLQLMHLVWFVDDSIPFFEVD